MSRRRSGSGGGGGFVGLIGVLFIVGLIIKFIWWIIGAAALVGLFYLVRAILRADARQRAALAQQMNELAARADQQHDWVMQGDDRGIYGPTGADLMHYVEQPGPGPARIQRPGPARTPSDSADRGQRHAAQTPEFTAIAHGLPS